MSQAILGMIKVRFLHSTTLELSIGPFSRSVTLSHGVNTMDVYLGDNQFTTLRLVGLDKAGFANKFTKSPSWSNADDSIATITPSDDGTTCKVSAAQPPKLGVTAITATDQDDSSVAFLTVNMHIGPEPTDHMTVTVDAPTEMVDDGTAVSTTPAAPTAPSTPTPPPTPVASTTPASPPTPAPAPVNPTPSTPTPTPGP